MKNLFSKFKSYNEKPNEAIVKQVRAARDQDKKHTVTRIQEYKNIRSDYTKKALKKMALAGIAAATLFVPVPGLPIAAASFGAIQIPGIVNALSKRADINDKLQGYKSHLEIIESNERDARRR